MAFVSIWVATGQGRGCGENEGFKVALRRLNSSKLTSCSSWTPVTMWFLILFLALSLGGIGEMREWEGSQP